MFRSKHNIRTAGELKEQRARVELIAYLSSFYPEETESLLPHGLDYQEIAIEVMRMLTRELAECRETIDIWAEHEQGVAQ